MIQEINMHTVASYKQPVAVSDLKRVNLFYGLNGTGKSTLSKFLAQQGKKELKFSDCDIKFQQNKPTPEILVYNQDFINENFLSTDTQKGIFTLDKSNTDAEKTIKNARNAIKNLEPLKEAQLKILETTKSSEQTDHKTIANAIWAEKTAYENTPLRPCLEGFMGSKDAFLKKLLSQSPATIETNKIPAELEKLKTEYEQLSSEESVEKTSYGLINLNFTDIETSSLLQERIVGSQDSYLSDLIAKLNHEPWVLAVVAGCKRRKGGQNSFAKRYAKYS